TPDTRAKPRPDLKAAWREARQLLARHRGRVALGLAIMLPGRVAGFVLPYSAKVFLDTIIGKHRLDLVGPLALAVGVATLIQAATTFALSNVMSIAAQRAIADMRRSVQAKVLRLPIAYFDST